MYICILASVGRIWNGVGHRIIESVEHKIRKVLGIIKYKNLVIYINVC